MSFIRIYLDDERETPRGWVRAYTVAEAQKLLLTRTASHLSCDNDLGEGEPEGYTLLDWLEQLVHDDTTFPIPIIMVHSANAARAPAMRQVAAKLEALRQQRLTQENE